MKQVIDELGVYKNNLDTYRILYIVSAVLNFLGVFGFGLYAVFGFIFIQDFQNTDQDVGWIMLLISGVGAFICALLGVLNLYTASCLRRRKNYNFIFVMAIVACLSGVLRLVLGIFTLIEITKPEVKALFYPEEKEESIVY
ncbi:hypothetical protein SAMN05216474_0387 [Lishizhenia tianjinensis]|uniref:MFS transporter n=1 Tax=Lishizhenia tianjinensis TaxID=477690 RepID=A0A1I6XRB4_9FLAO|nr:hypothetical protein [Lishizhenia tianjinensis]SFT40667.1 hypothetical protein SAMN05216474_0387 [Lishizhenia tianjinensis]